MEFNAEHDEMIAALAVELDNILSTHKVRLTGTFKPLMPAEYLQAYERAMTAHMKNVSAVTRKIARSK